jgi:hypothetical protein
VGFSDNFRTINLFSWGVMLMRATTTNYAGILMIAMGLATASHASAAMVVSYNGEDKTTRGTWVGVYGSDGYILPAAKASRGPVFDTVDNTLTPNGTNLDGIQTDYRSLPSYISGYTYDSPSDTGNVWDWSVVNPNPGVAMGSIVQNPGSLSPFSGNRPVRAHRPGGSTTTGFTTLTLNLTGVIPKTFDLHIYALAGGNARQWGGSYSIAGMSSIVFDSRQGGANNSAEENVNGAVVNDVDDLDLGIWFTFRITDAVAGPLAIQFNRNLTYEGLGVPFSAMVFDTVSVPEPSNIITMMIGISGMVGFRSRSGSRSSRHKAIRV